MLSKHPVLCPYCGELGEIEVDPSGGRHQAYEEDCPVCCRPWQVRVKIDGEGEIWVRVHSQDDVDGND